MLLPLQKFDPELLLATVPAEIKLLQPTTVGPSPELWPTLPPSKVVSEATSELLIINRHIHLTVPVTIDSHKNQ